MKGDIILMNKFRFAPLLFIICIWLAGCSFHPANGKRDGSEALVISDAYEQGKIDISEVYNMLPSSMRRSKSAS
jgi:hypothetical protein